MQMTVATTYGRTIWAFRYSSVGASRSILCSRRVDALRALYPDDPLLRSRYGQMRLVVSELLGDLAGVWREVPEASVGIVRAGEDALLPFRPV